MYRDDTSFDFFFLIYADDILITGNNSAHISALIHLLNLQFSMKDLGSLNYFLGIEIHRTSADLSLTQSKNIFDGASDSSFLMGIYFLIQQNIVVL